MVFVSAAAVSFAHSSCRMTDETTPEGSCRAAMLLSLSIVKSMSSPRITVPSNPNWNRERSYATLPPRLFTSASVDVDLPTPPSTCASVE